MSRPHFATGLHACFDRYCCGALCRLMALRDALSAHSRKYSGRAWNIVNQ